ncbi:uncharacterized protein LOC117102689 isoform X2 [Anneissia japonica]|nr:uncharacterized protein LOC117102689 isoform X2 [Anneissia japonica]
MGESAMSSHQQQPPPARQLLLPQQLQQLQAQILTYNYLVWNQPIPDWLRSAVQGNRLMQSLQRPSPDKIIKDYLTRQLKILYQDVNRMTPAIWHKHHEVDIAEVFTELSLLKSGKEDGAQNKSTCIRKEGKPTSLTEVLHIIKSTGSCKVLITGKGGMGKTTLLKYITYKWATDDVHNAFAGKLLFLINIGDIKAGTDILEIIMKNISTKELILQNNLPSNSVERFLINHADDIVILLDGYDELHSDAKDPIYLFKGLEFEKSTVVITSRPDNTIDLVKCCTIHIKVNGFSSRNIKEYIHKHFCSINKYKLGTLLIKEFKLDEDEFFGNSDHKEAFDLCSSPLLLLMVCTMWEQKQHLPKDLSDLFIVLICCILSQYKSKRNDRAAIFQIERIPEQYTLAILLLGECMYEGLKENKLSIDKYDLTKMSNDLLSVDLALELGFVYEESPFNSGDVRKIYTPPHKLISEALAGFYLANQIEKEHLKDDEYEVIRCNKYLNMTREFTVGFLGVKAGELLKHWLVKPSKFYSIAQSFKYVKKENEKPVLRKLDENMSTEMKTYCKQVHETFKSVLVDDTCRSEHFFKLMEKCCVTYGHNPGGLEHKMMSLIDTSSKESFRKSCRSVLLVLVIVQGLNNLHEEQFDSHYQTWHFLAYISNWNDVSLNILSAEMKSLQINYSDTIVCLDFRFNSSFLVHFLTHSNNLSVLYISNWLTEAILSVVTKELPKTNVKLTLKEFHILHSNLHDIDGALLEKLFGMAPELNALNVINCSLSSDSVRAMITGCRNSGGELCYLDISKNPIDDALLCDILKVYPNISSLKIVLCGLSKESFNNMVNGFPEIEVGELDFSHNYLGNLDGETFGKLMKKLPKLVFFGMNHCSLSGCIVNEMMENCDKMNVVLKDNILGVKGNDLSDIDGKSLAELLRVIQRFGTLSWSDYSLTADNLQKLVDSVSVNKTFSLNMTGGINLSWINLSSISGKTLACLFKIFPDLSFIDMSQCRLSGSIVNEMMEQCDRMNVVLKDNMLDLKGNDLSDIDGKSLAELLRVFQHLGTLSWSDYSLTADNLQKLVDSVGVNKTFSLNMTGGINLSGINLSSISGKTLACLFKIFPDKKHIDISHCSLSGSIVNEMMEECDRMNVVLKDRLDCKDNDLSDIDGKSLAGLFRLVKHYNHTFGWSDYSLTADNLQKLIESVGVNNILNWKKVDLSNIDLSSISGKILACLFKVSPDLISINLSHCSLSSCIVNEMIKECDRMNVVLKDRMFRLEGFDISDIDGKKLVRIIHQPNDDYFYHDSDDDDDDYVDCFYME